MPTRPGKACRVTQCKNIAQPGKHQGYCEQHKDRAGWHRNEKEKGNSQQRGYGSQWRKIRERALKRDAHLCQECRHNKRFTRATHVDHIKPKFMGGTDTLDNLQSLCVACHNAKTAREKS